MIQLSLLFANGDPVPVENRDEIRVQVEMELDQFNKYLVSHLHQPPMGKFERVMVGEYLHAKIRGLVPPIESSSR